MFVFIINVVCFILKWKQIWILIDGRKLTIYLKSESLSIEQILLYSIWKRDVRVVNSSLLLLQCERGTWGLQILLYSYSNVKEGREGCKFFSILTPMWKRDVRVANSSLFLLQYERGTWGLQILLYSYSNVKEGREGWKRLCNDKSENHRDFW